MLSGRQEYRKTQRESEREELERQQHFLIWSKKLRSERPNAVLYTAN